MSEVTTKRIVLQLPYSLAPFKVAILPLMKKDGLAEKALEIHSELRKNSLSSDYDVTGSIGKRYARQDENGTPWCVCVDYQTLEDNTVTIRHRDTTEQVRISLDELSSYISTHFAVVYTLNL
jgi:glycyl-tRNA synthetase